MAVVGRDLIFAGRHAEHIAEGHWWGIPTCRHFPWHLPPVRSALPGPVGETSQGYGFRALKTGRCASSPVKHSQFVPGRRHSPGMEGAVAQGFGSPS